MMKKLLLMLLLVTGGVMSASAWTTVKLLNSVEGVWNESASTVMTVINDGSTNFWYYILDSSTVTDVNGNYYFRFYLPDESKYVGSWENDFAILNYTNYGCNDSQLSFKLVTDKSSKYIISAGYWDNSWHTTATTYSGTADIIYVNNSNFTAPTAYVYCTGEARLTGGWPGTPMVNNGNGTWILRNVNVANNTKVIFSDNGTNQTSDFILTNDAVFDKDVQKLSVNAAVTSLGYATFSSAYPLDFTNVSGLKAYKVTSTGTGNGIVKLAQVTGMVPAATGLLLKSDNGGTANVNIPTAICTDDNVSNMLVASVTEVSLTGGSTTPYRYILGNAAEGIGFYFVNETRKSDAGKAYLESDTNLKPANGARVSWIFEDQETTGINSVKSASLENEVYNLNGQRVNNAVRGLYIVNGKKVIMK